MSKHQRYKNCNRFSVEREKNPASASASFLPARHVRERYHISDMTLWRWLHDESMGFPKPVYLGRYRYWRVADIEAWEAEQEARGAA